MIVTILQFYFVRDVFKISEIFKNSRKYFVASIVMCIVSIEVGRLINNNVLSILVQICVSVIIYFILLLILKDELVLEEIKKMELLKAKQCQK